MCGSPATSLATFLVSSACMTHVWHANVPPQQWVATRWLPPLVVTFATMQLVDTVLWFSYRGRDHAVNHWTSRVFLPLVLLSECWIGYICAVRFAHWRSLAFEACLSVFTVAVLVHWYITCSDVTTPGDPDEYLRWCGRDFEVHLCYKVLFLVFMLLPIVVAFPEGTLRTQGRVRSARASCPRAGAGRFRGYLGERGTARGLRGALVLVRERAVAAGGAGGADGASV